MTQPPLRATQIVDAVADAARRWTDADFGPRVRAVRALVARTGYTEPVVEYALDRLFGGIDRTRLVGTIAGELGALEALDGFVARPGRPAVFFRGFERVAIVSSDTTIGVAIPALVFALCAKSEVLVKDRDDGLVSAFAATLAEERAEIGARVRAETWSGDDDQRSRAHLGDAQVVVAFGRDATLARIRALTSPGARFVGFGHSTSAGYVAREHLTGESEARACARAAARDALLYDGDGCLSIHALFVERGGRLKPEAFARLLAAACDEIAIEFPAGYAEFGDALVVYERAARFRAAQGQGAVLAGRTGPHLVVLDPPRADPPPLLRRTLACYGVDGPSDALSFVRQHALPLEAVGLIEPARADVVEFALASGATRVGTLGRLQDPPLEGEHGGVGRILPFVRAVYAG